MATVGHGTRTLEAFIRLLQGHGIRQLVDIRTVPRSRHNPQFAQDTLGPALQRVGIRYRHMPALGGFRKPQADSVNGGWRNASFRGYADYMQTEAFAAALATLIQLACDLPTAVMCAEAVPWRCHRSLVADALGVRGLTVSELASPRKAVPHILTPFARVTGRQITYPPQPAETD